MRLRYFVMSPAGSSLGTTTRFRTGVGIGTTTVFDGACSRAWDTNASTPSSLATASARSRVTTKQPVRIRAGFPVLVVYFIIGGFPYSGFLGGGFVSGSSSFDKRGGRARRECIR